MYSTNEVRLMLIFIGLVGIIIGFISRYLIEQTSQKGGVPEVMEEPQHVNCKNVHYAGNGYDDKELKRLVDTHESVLIFHDKAIELLFLPELDIKDFEFTKDKKLKTTKHNVKEFRIGRDRFVKVDNNGYDVDYYLYKKEGY